MSTNPYESPLIGGVSAMAGEIQLADRITRLVATIVDGLIMMAVIIPVTFVLVLVARIELTEFMGQVIGAILGIIVYLAINGSLLASNGQTVGKRMMGIKIVRSNGEKATFERIVGYRLAPVWFVSMIPIVGGLLGLINVLMIFRANRKCLHDDIADTIVIRA